MEKKHTQKSKHTKINKHTQIRKHTRVNKHTQIKKQKKRNIRDSFIKSVLIVSFFLLGILLVCLVQIIRTDQKDTGLQTAAQLSAKQKTAKTNTSSSPPADSHEIPKTDTSSGSAADRQETPKTDSSAGSSAAHQTAAPDTTLVLQSPTMNLHSVHAAHRLPINNSPSGWIPLTCRFCQKLALTW